MLSYRNHPQRAIRHILGGCRHWKDGAHGNQLSKAELLLSGDALAKRFPDRFFYFPSYEIVMDELRDYRFYADDMLHTSDQTTAYIWEKFQQVLISEPSKVIIHDLEPILKMQGHRPMNTGEKARQKMKVQLEEKIRIFKTRHPDIDI